MRRKKTSSFETALSQHRMHHPFMRDRNDLEGMYMAVARMMGHEAEDASA